MSELSSSDIKCRCCQNCMAQATPSKPLRSCAKCKLAHYCSRECQTAHWQKHKATCRHNVELLEQMKAATINDEGDTQATVMERQKKWLDSNRGPLTVLVCKALTKAQLSTHIVDVAIAYEPNNAKQFFYTVEDIAVISLDEAKQLNRNMYDAIQTAMRNKPQAAHGGGKVYTGICVIQCPEFGTARIVPLSTDEGGYASAQSLPFEQLVPLMNAGGMKAAKQAMKL